MHLDLLMGLFQGFGIMVIDVGVNFYGESSQGTEPLFKIQSGVLTLSSLLENNLHPGNMYLLIFLGWIFLRQNLPIFLLIVIGSSQNFIHLKEPYKTIHAHPRASLNSILLKDFLECCKVFIQFECKVSRVHWVEDLMSRWVITFLSESPIDLIVIDKTHP